MICRQEPPREPFNNWRQWAMKNGPFRARIWHRVCLFSKGIMSTAPPISLASETPITHKPFARRAATVCLAMPLLSIGLGFAYQQATQRLSSGNLFLGALIVGTLVCLFLLISVVSGFVALAMMRKADWVAVVLRSFAGLSLCGLLFAVVVPN